MNRIKELNDYQAKAMSTCMPSCDNFVYGINGLTAEVGEFNDKVAKWVRKGICGIDNNQLIFNIPEEEAKVYILELMKELGDVMWFPCLLAKLFGYTLEDVCQINIDKLRDRANRNVIDGNGDNR